MAEGPWYCTCQRAGPLVKECRAIRPRLARTDSREDRRDKKEIIRSPHSAVCRSQADRLELRLALFGFEGTHYTLTYDSVHLPRTFREAMATKRAFMARARRFNEGQPFDWVTCVEGLHGDHRYHIHLVLRYSDFPPAVVRHLWRAGEVDDEPVLMPTGGYRRLAEYLTKERPDGIIIPSGGGRGTTPGVCPSSCLHRSDGGMRAASSTYRTMCCGPGEASGPTRSGHTHTPATYKAILLLICRARPRAHPRAFNLEI